MLDNVAGIQLDRLENNCPCAGASRVHAAESQCVVEVAVECTYQCYIPSGVPASKHLAAGTRPAQEIYGMVT